MHKMAQLFLTNETRRRKSIRLSPLTDHEQGIILDESGNLIRRSQNGMTFENIKQSSKLLRIVAREVVAESDNDLYASALFAAQYRRVYAELNLIKASVGSGKDLTSQELEALEGPIKRLYQYLYQDTTWRHVLRHLGLMTESLALIRSKIRASSNLHQYMPLATATDAIERLLMPTDCREEDLAASLDPLEVALKDNRDLQAKLTGMSDEYKAIINTKEEKLIECNIRLKSRADLPNHGRAQSEIFKSRS
ncbi:hypothetical protein BDU57DRAFT_82493 [Ampelomyces quisqualis]|uniref:Uncharacterized protein n=1 Tax=Ampelomyces quisqualis TaxID=50730 RepID=A0A6A5QBK4_AMPQU|nr:hypothetical protein BDU57DRAFT_82493 [Ampelomyces quisqualis]